MRPGDMLKILHEVEDALPDMLREGADAWHSLDIAYEPPHVERLWIPYGEFRVYLHRIWPCETALFHPHPWPSAIRVVTGRYEMGIGYGCPEVVEVARVVLGPGDQYEMVNPVGFHYVKPLDQPSLSLMVTARPYGLNPPVFDHDMFGKGVAHRPLSKPAREHLLGEFAYAYHYWRSNR